MSLGGKREGSSWKKDAYAEVCASQRDVLIGCPLFILSESQNLGGNKTIHSQSEAEARLRSVLNRSRKQYRIITEF